MIERKKEKDINCLRLNEKDKKIDKKIDRQIYNYCDRQADGRTNW